MVLMVSRSSRISPRASTVIFCERSPFATAVVTLAMLRSCAVRLAERPFTSSVRSFHVPVSPFSEAWPPSLPSLPTSRTTRRTSADTALSWSTSAFTLVAIRRNSPRTGRPPRSSATFCERSPVATAVSTRATSFVGATRSEMSWFTAPTLAAQAPRAGPTEARSVERPSSPTTRPTRTSSSAACSFSAIRSFSSSPAWLSRPSRR
ncbi:hypothetical protein PSR1_03629 [Anaeromyxobacter sp. PSR-1]|nr:hypothetical protein PSR1_03629 [Anaeromyxobacter sp. PSR-1]